MSGLSPRTGVLPLAVLDGSLVYLVRGSRSGATLVEGGAASVPTWVERPEPSG